MKTLSTSDVLIEYLVAAGVDRAFGYPGGPTIEIMESARRHGVGTVLARREGTAGVMAQAYAVVSGTTGFCISTLGPGSTSLVPGVASAYLDRVPVIALSGQTSTAREQTFTHQVVDHARLFAPITKWTARLAPNSVGSTVRKALRIAHSERPGPVHLTLPSDVAASPAEDDDVRLPPLAAQAIASQVAVRGEGDPFDVVRAARRPVILAGTGAVRARAVEDLVALAGSLAAPVVVSGMAKGVYPEDGPWFAGVLDMAANEVVWDLLEAADLVIAVGFDPVELIKNWTVSTPVCHVDSVPNVDQVYEAAVEMIGDLPTLLQALSAEGGGPRWTEKAVTEHRDRLREAYYAGRTPGVLNPSDVLDVLARSLPTETIVTTDVGSHKLMVGQGWTSTEPSSCLMTNGLSAMGFSLPAAIAAKLAKPERPVLCTVGDGGLAMVQGELALASELGLGMLVVVFCDNSLHRIELKQKLKGYPSTATRLAPNGFARAAEYMGCDGAIVKTESELESVLQEVSDVAARTRPLVIEAHIDPTQYEAQF